MEMAMGQHLLWKNKRPTLTTVKLMSSMETLPNYLFSLEKEKKGTQRN